MTSDEQRDELLLIDLLTGQLEGDEAETLHERLRGDAALRQKHDDLKATFGALDLAAETDAPDDLAERALARIASVERTNALLAMQQSGSGRKATFSLKELAAVAAMLLVMVGVFVPALHKARQRSQEGLCAMRMGQIGNALQTYAINHDSHYPSVSGPPKRWLRHDDTPPASNSAALFKLLRARYLTSPVVFQCPAVGGPSFAITPEMHDFPDAKHISYSYQYALGGRSICSSDPLLAKHTAKMAILADQTPLFPNGVFAPERVEEAHSENHSDGQNVLYLDGHVSWEEAANVGVNGDHIFLADDVHEYDGDETPSNSTDTFLLPSHP